MGDIRNKARENLKDNETWRMKERQENVNKLIRRLNIKKEEPRMVDDARESFYANFKKEKVHREEMPDKEEKWCENNNSLKNVNKNVDLNVPSHRNGEPECCEAAKKRKRRDVDVNVTIKKKDSIDNIIDMIVSKSIRRDEVLTKIIEDTERSKLIKRCHSFHGGETWKKSTMENFEKIEKPEEEESLATRLDNLEKRATMFEKNVGKLQDWFGMSSGIERQRSRSSAASEEFERNMIEVLEENYKDDDSLNVLKTIERVKPSRRILEKDELIAAPKADPIIRNSIKKIVYRVTKSLNVEPQASAEVNPDDHHSEISSMKPGDSKESLIDRGWVIVQNRVSKIANGSVVTDETPKLNKPLVKSSPVPNGTTLMNGSAGRRDLPRVSGGWVSNGMVKHIKIRYSAAQIQQTPSAVLLTPEKSKSDRRDKGGKTYCQTCKKKCTGEVLKVQDKYFHKSCFKCKTCKVSLAQGGFFGKDNDYYCTNDYQRQFGTKCCHCGEYVVGEVVSALGETYHVKCFTCSRCRQVFPAGERVTYKGKEILCQKCVQIPIRDTRSPARSPSGPNECAGCGEELKDGQALIALERQWHIWCFKCASCDSVLHGEYMGKDGVPYCEKDYQKQFGVKCAYCSRFISGKVLQAGENHHFHPTCARCSKCGDPFGDGEEMYLQGGAIWHPRCGPGPTENGTIVNGSTALENDHCTDTDGELSGREGRDYDRMSSSAVSEMQFSLRSRTPSFNGSLGSPYNSLNRKYAYHRTGSPGIILREYKSNQQFPEDISRIYTYSYLTEEPSQGYLKRPIDPYDKPPTSPHFHRPSSSHSQRSGKILIKTGSKSGMKVMAESIRSETPRPKSPHMNNEEPIELAHFPDAKKPKPGEKSKIERDDFPAPPYPYTDPERRKRWSDSHKGASDEEQDEADTKDKDSGDDKLKKEEEELSKIATGIGKVFLQNVKEREKLRQYKLQHLDPRNASRVPSANKEPAYRLRYQSPVNASPSRNMDHPRPWEEEDYMDRSSSYRSSVGRSVGAIPSYNATSMSRLGYVRSPRKASTLPTGRYMSGYCSDYGVGYNGDFSCSGFGEKTHSTEFSSGKSDISGGSISEVDRRVLNADMPTASYQSGLRYSSYSPHLRRSLPTLSHMNNEPPKIYPYHLLVITNYRLPADVDRCNLERHLSENEFEQKFQCSRAEFYRMPQWRRNDLKRRLKLF